MLFTFHGVAITLLRILMMLFLIVLIVMYVRHRQWTYIITDRQIYVRKGIIASDARSFLYDQVQEASSFQTQSGVHTAPSNGKKNVVAE